MKRYILKKMITAFFIVLVVIVINFLIIKLAPGDPVRILAGADTVTEDMIEALTIEFGLDQPLHVQLWKYIVNLFHGDLGDSFAYSQPVTTLIAERFGNSLLLSGTSAILAVILGCWLGLYAGKNHGGLLDYIMTFRVTGMSEKKIFRKYILKNAILPVLTVFGINLAYVVSGSTLTEIVFSWPGIGSMMYRAIMMRDYNVLMGIYLILALSVAAMMIVVDLVYAWLDPRIRYT